MKCLLFVSLLSVSILMRSRNLLEFFNCSTFRPQRSSAGCRILCFDTWNICFSSSVPDVKILTFFSLIYDPLFFQQVYKRIFTRFFGYANESLCVVMYFFSHFFRWLIWDWSQPLPPPPPVAVDKRQWCEEIEEISTKKHKPPSWSALKGNGIRLIYGEAKRSQEEGNMTDLPLIISPSQGMTPLKD